MNWYIRSLRERRPFMPEKPKVAFYWCASCGGCEESVVDLAEDLLGVASAVDIVFWPVAMDFKRKDVEAIPDGGILVSLINGAVRTSEQEEMARLLRRKSALVVAYGSCAHLGGIPGLANQFDREQIFRYVYEDSPSTVNEAHARPQTSSTEDGHTTSLPEFRSMVRPLDGVIPVDYYLPGCPPVPRMLKAALETLLSGTLPPKGTVLCPDTALCQECPRKESKPADLAFTTFHRPHEIMIQGDTCLLAQGVICMGPATRGGCGAQCVTGNMPCTGCFGPTSRVKDQGAKILSAIASSLAAKDEGEIDAALSTIPDPIGTFYRYGLPGSLLRRKIADHN
jgi:F420-non-reducing hydrogenase small subunit